MAISSSGYKWLQVKTCKPEKHNVEEVPSHHLLHMRNCKYEAALTCRLIELRWAVSAKDNKPLSAHREADVGFTNTSQSTDIEDCLFTWKQLRIKFSRCEKLWSRWLSHDATHDQVHVTRKQLYRWYPSQSIPRTAICIEYLHSKS